MTLAGFREEGPSTLRDYLQILRRGKWLILQAVIIIPAVAVIWELRGDTVYRASADVLMNTQNLAANLEGVFDPSQVNPGRVIKTQVSLARVPEIGRRTIEAVGLEGWSPSDLIETSTVTSFEDNDVITFVVTNPDPALSARLATEYARQFTLYRLELDTGAIATAREAVEARIGALEAAGQQGSALYGTLVEREERLATLESLQTSRAVLVRPATGAAELGPQPRRKAMFGIVLALLIGVGLAFLREAVDTRVRSTDEIGREIALPLLGRIAEPPPTIRRRRQLVTLAEPYGPHAEAFRMLVSNIAFMDLESRARVIMLTSAVEREGKSTTAANLAVAFARAGKRVALVDFDPYSAGLHHFEDRLPRSGRSRRPGLTEVLLGKASLEACLSSVDVSRGPSWAASTNGREPSRSDGRLEFLPSGPVPSTLEFGDSTALADVLEALQERSDLVLIDAPPLLRTADALAASSRVDALLLVVRLNFVRRPMLSDLRRVLDSSPAQKLGFIATGAEAETGYGYLSSPYFQRRESASV